MLKVTDILASEKTSHFSLLFFLETLNLVSDWIRTHDLAHRSPITIPLYQASLLKNFQKSLSQILREIYNLLAAVSPVGLDNNRQFLLKRQKTKIVNNFLSRPCICMKLSGCMRKYIVYDISLMFLMRQ